MTKRRKCSGSGKHGMTRRELLKNGGNAALGLALIPVVKDLFRLTPAWAASQKAAYVHFKLPGGYSFVSDFVALSTSGQRLPNSAYATHGATLSTNPNTTWGAPMWNTVGDQSMPSLIAQLTAANVPSEVKFATFASMHAIDVKSWVDPMQLIASYLGRNAPDSASFKTMANPMAGGSDLVPLPGYNPVLIDGPDDYVRLLKPQVGPLTTLSAAQMRAIAALAGSLSNRHATQIAASGSQGSDVLADGVKTGYASVSESFSGGLNVAPPSADPIISANFTKNTVGQSVLAALVKLLIDQRTQAISFDCPGLASNNATKTFGAYDIHQLNGQQAFQAGMDFYASYLIPTIKALIQANIPFYMDITTDGSSNWSGPLSQGGAAAGDSTGLSMVVSVAWSPNVSNPFTTNRVGAYKTTDGNVDPNASPVGNSETNCAAIRAVSALTFFGYGASSSTSSAQSPLSQDPLLRNWIQYAITRPMG